MFKIWTITILAAIALYECLKYFVQLIVSYKLRYSMLILFISSIFAHYYGWWMYVNYYNDCFYSQFYHQLFFSVSIMNYLKETLHETLTLLLTDNRIDLYRNGSAFSTCRSWDHHSKSVANCWHLDITYCRWWFRSVCLECGPWERQIASSYSGCMVYGSRFNALLCSTVFASKANYYVFHPHKIGFHGSQIS